MPRSSRKTRPVAVTVWLAILLVANGAQAVEGLASTGLVRLSLNAAVESDNADFEMDGLTRDELVGALSMGMRMMYAEAAARMVLVGAVGAMLFFRKWGFWLYCSVSGSLFLFNLWGGSSFWQASVDLVALGILVATLFLLEPITWHQFE